MPGTKSVAPTTLSSSTGNIAPGWTPSGYRFISPNQQYAMNRAVQNNQKTLTAARNKETFDRLMYGDYGSGFINAKIDDEFSFPTNSFYLNSLLPYEQIAGVDSIEMENRNPNYFTGFYPFNYGVTRLKHK